MFFGKKKRTRADYTGEGSGSDGSKDDDFYNNKVLGNDMYDDKDPYAIDENADHKAGYSEAAREVHLRFNFRWYELTVIFIELLLVLYLILVFSGVVPLF